MVNRPLRALIVDDEALIRWALSQQLARHGCEVVQADDGHRATESLAHEGPFDLVVLDYRLPAVAGPALVVAARHYYPHARIILMSALMSPDESTQAIASGASSVLEKPFSLEAFTSVAFGDLHGALIPQSESFRLVESGAVSNGGEAVR
jgi:DNA-binding NtrC family response regulator